MFHDYGQINHSFSFSSELFKPNCDDCEKKKVQWRLRDLLKICEKNNKSADISRSYSECLLSCYRRSSRTYKMGKHPRREVEVNSNFYLI